jgi:MarR family transcriptional regulator, 2-MHQ and catechol-resistance regulon repressor
VRPGLRSAIHAGGRRSRKELLAITIFHLSIILVYDLLMSTDARFDDPRLTTVGLLFETTQGLAAAFGHALAKEGLSLSEFEVLLRLARSPEQRLRMSDLAAQTTLSTSGITRVVDRLEKEALVERVSCPSDRRGYHATLTDAGARKLTEQLPEHYGLIDELVVSRLGASDIDVFTDALRKVRDAVRPTAVQGAEGIAT